MADVRGINNHTGDIGDLTRDIKSDFPPRELKNSVYRSLGRSVRRTLSSIGSSILGRNESAKFVRCRRSITAVALRSETFMISASMEHRLRRGDFERFTYRLFHRSGDN